MADNKKRGLTLLEVVVLILVVGVLAAVVVPRLIHGAQTGADRRLKQSLGLIRDAIAMFAADHQGALPGADGTSAALINDLTPYLRPGQMFPACSIGAKNNQVRVQTTGEPLYGEASPAMGWAYDNKSGQFIANSNAVSSDGVTLYQDL